MARPETPGRNGDDGAALVIAFITITVFSLIAAAVAGFAMTSFKNTAAVSNKIDKIAAAESGVRHVFDQVKRFSGSCPPSELLYQPTVNDFEVDVSCRYDGIGPVLGTQWALVLLDDPATFKFLSQGGSKVVNGPVYLESLPWELDESTGGVQELIIEDGFVYANTCEAPATTNNAPPWLWFRVGAGEKFTGSVPGLLTCGRYEYPKTYQQYLDTGVPAPLPPDTRPTVPNGLVVQADVPPTATDPSPYWPVASNNVVEFPDCRIFEPGVYRGLGEWDLSARGDSKAPDEVYFRPGVYYFEDTFLNIKATNVKAGRGSVAVKDAQEELSFPDCAPTEGEDGGATLIMGGESHIRISNSDGRLEIFVREACEDWPGAACVPTDDTLAGVAVYAVPPDLEQYWPDGVDQDTFDVIEVDETVVNAQSSCGPSAPFAIIDAVQGQNPAFGTNGRIVTPRHMVCLKVAGQDAAFIVSGGVIAAAAEIQVAGSGEGLALSGSGAELPYRIVARATAKGSGSRGNDVTATAVVQVITYTPPDGTSPITELAINSWRVA